MTGIDNALGLSVGGSHGAGTEYLNTTVELHDSKIFGESPLPDCPQDGEGGYCFKDLAKCGIQSSFAQEKARTFHPTAPSAKPMHTTNSFSAWGTTAHFFNN